MLSFILGCKRIWNHFSENEISVYAAQASLFIIIAFFPFLMLMLTLIQFIPTVSKSDVLTLLVRLMPDMLDSLVVGIVDDLYVKSPGTILSITALTALWSSAKGMMSIEQGLNRIYGYAIRRNYILRRIICAGYTLIFMLACIVSLVLLVFGSSLQKLLRSMLPFFARITQNIISFRSLLSMILFLLCFVGLYTIVPWKKQNPWHQLPGAIFSTLGWLGFSYAFSLYFTHFSSFSYMYGSLTAIVLMMLWLYFCICILFFGATINHFLEDDSPKL